MSKAALPRLDFGVCETVRTTLAISAFAHAAVWALAAMHGGYPLSESPETPIAVELVSPEEMEKLSKTDSQDASTPQPAPSQPAPTPDPRQGQQSPEQPREQSEQRSRDAEGAARPTSSMLPELQPGSSWLDSALTPLLASAFEASGMSANLAQNEIAAFKSHLQECWRPPADLADAQKLVVVLRVSLRPDGALNGDPIMVAASASAKGPALMQTAIRALRRCQPYAFLPATKYKEWKVLDLSFSPSGLKTAPLL
jgi:hypothetical protein